MSCNISPKNNKGEDTVALDYYKGIVKDETLANNILKTITSNSFKVRFGDTILKSNRTVDNLPKLEGDLSTGYFFIANNGEVLPATNNPLQQLPGSIKDDLINHIVFNLIDKYGLSSNITDDNIISELNSLVDKIDDIDDITDNDDLIQRSIEEQQSDIVKLVQDKAKEHDIITISEFTDEDAKSEESAGIKEARDSREFSAWSKLGNRIKANLETVKMEFNGKTLMNPQALSLPMYYSSSDVFSKLLSGISGIMERTDNENGFKSVKEQTIERLKILSKISPIYEQTLERFKADDKFAKDLIHAAQVTKDKYITFGTKDVWITVDGKQKKSTVMTMSYANKDGNIQSQLINSWNNSIIDSLTISSKDNKYKANADILNKIDSTKKSLNAIISNASKGKEALSLIKDLYSLMGIELSDEAVAQLNSTSDGVNTDNIYKLIEGENSIISLVKENGGKSFTNKALKSIITTKKPTLNKIADVQAIYAVELSDDSIQVSNKKLYTFTPTTWHTRIINQYKSGDLTFLEQVSELPINEGNALIKYLLAKDKNGVSLELTKRQNRIQTGMLTDSFNENNDNVELNKTIEADFMTNLITGTYRTGSDAVKNVYITPVAADKGSQLATFGIGLNQGILKIDDSFIDFSTGEFKEGKREEFLKLNTKVVEENLLPKYKAETSRILKEVELTSDAIRVAFKKLNLDKLKESRELNSELFEKHFRKALHEELIKSGFELITFYNVNKSNNLVGSYTALYDTLVSSESVDDLSLTDILVSSGANAYQYTLFNSKELLDIDPNDEGAIVSQLTKEITNLFTEFLKTNVDNGNMDNSDKDVISKINKAVAKSSIMSGSFWNSLTFNIDQTNFLLGDPAYYKTFNDLIKRTQLINTDGIYLVINDKKDLNFTAAVVSDHESKSHFYDDIVRGFTDKTLAKPYNKVNRGDAQGIITQKRALFILEHSNKLDDKKLDLVKTMVNEPHKLNESDMKKAKKIMMQPFKGVMGAQRNGNNKSVETYFKYSQMVLFPGMSPQGDALLKQMETKKIDETIFISGVKVGATNVSDLVLDDDNFIDFNNMKLNPVEYSNLDYKIQQDLTYKGFKERALIASQIQKNVLSGIDAFGDIEGSVKKAFVDVYNDEFTDIEVLNELFQVTTQKMEINKNKVLKKLGVIQNEDGTFDIEEGKESKIIDLMVDQIKDDATDSDIRLLKVSKNLDTLPQFRKKFEQIILSQFNKAVTNLKAPGGSEIQVSGVFSKNLTEVEKSGIILLDSYVSQENTGNTKFKQLKSPIKQDGSNKVKSGQVLIGSNTLQRFFPQNKTESFEDYVVRFNKMVTEGKIDKRIFDGVIGYRIPNQSMASNDVLEIVGILPPSMGDSIILYDDVTTKTGSDFDIDKMYMMFPEVQVNRKGFIKKLKDYIKGDLISDFDGQVGYYIDVHGETKENAEYKAKQTLLKDNQDEAISYYKDVVENNELEDIDEVVAEDIQDILDNTEVESVEYVETKVNINEEEVKLAGGIEDKLTEIEILNNIPNDTGFDEFTSVQGLDKYELFPGVFANEEQKKAIDNISNHLENFKTPYLLEGKGGTGKTTIIKKVLSEFAGKEAITVSALSHKAKGVIAKSVKDLNIQSVTLAALFGKTLNAKLNIFVENKFKPSIIENVDIVVVDEASMVTEEHLVDLKNSGAKVVFMGDSGQLPPIRNAISYYYLAQEVGSDIGISDEDMTKLHDLYEFFDSLKYMNKNQLNRVSKSELDAKSRLASTIASKYNLDTYDSPVFRLQGNNKSMLTERMRQGEESPILPYADYYWNNSHKENPEHKPAPKTKSVINDNGTLQFTSNDKLSDVVLGEFKKSIELGDPNLIKAVMFRNDTRIAFNGRIRDYLEFTGNYNTGEHIIITTATETSPFQNSDELVIKKSEEIKRTIAGVEYNVHRITVDFNDKEVVFDTITPDEKRKVFDKHINTLWKTDVKSAIKLTYGTFEFIDYGYAITSHKAQGSTYNTVIVDENDIMSVKMNDNKQKSQSMYVAITRAKNNVIILNGSDNRVETLNQSKEVENPSVDNETVDIKAEVVDNTQNDDLIKAEKELKSLIDKFVAQSDEIECVGHGTKGGKYSIVEQ